MRVSPMESTLDVFVGGRGDVAKTDLDSELVTGFARLQRCLSALSPVVAEYVPAPQSCNLLAFSYYDRLARVDRFVQRHYGDPLPLKVAARIAGLEQSYFSKFFREKVGICYLEWLAWVRVRYAVALMHTRTYRSPSLPSSSVSRMSEASSERSISTRR